MKNDKFLTVFAVFDDKTQKYLKELQNKIIEKGLIGKQTMDIPFHISLGSFPVSEEQKLIEKIKSISKVQKSFDIKLEKIGFFGDRVVFAEPVVNEELINLHNEFDNNFANGFDWHAHATLFIDENEENVKIAKEIAIKNFIPQDVEIVGLQMGEFFPTRMIIKEKLRRKNGRIRIDFAH